MQWFWHAIWIALVVIPVTILWLGCVLDLFRRHDLSVVAQVLWLVGVLVLPVLGALIYLIARPRAAGAFGELSPAPSNSLTEQLSDLDRLHSTGAIDDREFQLAKEDVLARVPTPRDATAGYSPGAATATGSRP